ncbi:MAG TPA: hemolysin III family protein [Propionibacteriaceae bacterium]|nr:hemolysin III family protein [Propionibacteriaceae bacterium]
MSDAHKLTKASDDESGLHRALDDAWDGLGQIADELKPRLRGWLHTVMAPLMTLAGLALVVLTPTVGGRVAAAVYLICSILLFGVSATYHRGSWTDTVKAVFRRVDHANIFLFIAGTYTPLAYQLLTGGARVTLLSLIWGAAALGVGFRVFWLSAPRLLYTALYVAMGWAAVGWMVPLWRAGGPLVVLLVIAGGLIYTAGAVVYARKRPNPSPRWFGFHEIFHACTVAAALCHFAAIALATFAR